MKQYNKIFNNCIKIFLGKKLIITKKDQYEFEAFLFSLNLLVPENTLLKIINIFGGIDEVIDNDYSIKTIANIFNVEIILIKLRIYGLLNKDKVDYNLKKVLK